MPQYAGYVDNEFTTGCGELLTVENPSDESELASFPGLSVSQVEADHAIAMANDSHYGLSGYVHGEDRALALKVGTRIRCGTVHVNTPIVSADVSFGGHRMSGIGRERGIEGLRQYQQLSCLNLG